MNQITAIYMNYGRLEKGTRYRLTDGAPIFSWSVEATHKNGMQKACALQVLDGTELLWDSGWVETPTQQMAYAGAPLPPDRELTVRVSVEDDRGDRSQPETATFYAAALPEKMPGWIAASEDAPRKAVYFRKAFPITGQVTGAALYACGLGYHKIYLNGEELDTAVLDPLHSDYTKSCYYTVLPGLQDRLADGDNCLSIVIGEGWRRAPGICSVDPNGTVVDFFGQPQLSATLRITYADGRQEVLDTDSSWEWSHGPIVENDFLDGETYDAGAVAMAYAPVKMVEAPGGVARIMTMEPITQHECFTPRSIQPIGEDTYVVDFGVNIAGVCRLRLPRTMQAGQTIRISHMEMLQEDGSVYMAPTRSAKQTDTYVAAGDERDLVEWQPQFTYHGFRYAQITGYPFLSREDICAVDLYTDVRSHSVFTCGSGLVNTIQEAIVRSEKNNIHGLLTDCPQRDERMGWLNDATVRFEETPYNFHIGRLFPKVIRDIQDVQEADGSITCTAPHVFGCRPADPACSSYLVAGLECLLHTGNVELIRTTYDGFAAWQRCLSEHTDGDIVNYSYYGDWAAPEYACAFIHWPFSNCTPGDFMSTGFYYLNATLLTRFAAEIGREEDRVYYAAQADRIRAAMLERWYDPATGRVATGSQACQSFALWLGIIPEEGRPAVAKYLHEELVNNDYRITTGNLCTRYMYDALTANGYIDDAWALITRELYPSLGYMIQNEATTLWERFELKKSPAMNSHDHPMYGAVGYWFYAYLAGIRPTAPGYEQVEICPYFPKGLRSVNATVDTVKGDITVRWVKHFGKLHLYVTVPFGVQATVRFDGGEHKVGSGFWVFEREEEDIERTDLNDPQ